MDIDYLAKQIALVVGECEVANDTGAAYDALLEYLRDELPGTYTGREMRLIGERDAALKREEDAERERDAARAERDAANRRADEMIAERDEAISTDLEQLNKNYLDVADALLPSSTGSADLIAKVHSLRASAEAWEKRANEDRIEVERERDAARAELASWTKQSLDYAGTANTERDAAQAECERLSGKLARAEMHSSVAVTAADSLRESVERHTTANAFLSARVLELELIIRDCAPVMITVSAFNADEADGRDLKEIATWYGKAERSYSAFDVWLFAARAHNAELKAKADARKEPG